MAENIKYTIAKYGDRKWIDVFKQAIDEGFSERAIFYGIGGLSEIKITNSDELPDLLEFYHHENGASLRLVTGNKGGLTVRFDRSENPLYDNLTFSWDKGPESEIERAKIITWFTKQLLNLNPERGLFYGTDIAQAAENELAVRSATIERFEQVAAKLAEDTAAFNKTIQENFLQEKHNLEKTLEQEREKLFTEVQKKENALEQRSSALDKREASIDSLDNTAARRQIRKDLLEELQRRSEKFALTQGTTKLRWPVHLVSVAIIVTGLLGAFFFGSMIPDPTNSNSVTYFVSLLKPVGLSFIAVGTAFFYLRWLNRWFEQHAQAEFKLKQFQLDIERASWLVETALDWGSAKEGELPRELLEGLSRNLFSFEGEKIDPVRHPVDELASALIGTASKVRLNIAGNEVELEGNRLKKLKSKNNQD